MSQPITWHLSQCYHVLDIILYSFTFLCSNSQFILLLVCSTMCQHPTCSMYILYIIKPYTAISFIICSFSSQNLFLGGHFYQALIYVVKHLFYFILSYLILSYLILFYLILFYFILFYFILFYFILFYLILSYLILFYFILFILFYLILFYLILFYLILSYFILFYLILFYSLNSRPGSQEQV